MIKKISNSRVFYIVVSLLAAILLWLYVTNVENPDKATTINGIPVSFIGEDIFTDKNFVITKGEDATVSLTIEGRLSYLNKINKDNIVVTVDLSRVNSEGDYELAYEVALPESVSRYVTTTQRSPEYYIELTVDKLVTKPVEVKGEFVGETAEGYRTEAMTFDPEYIEIKGTEDDLAIISHAKVVMNRTNVDKTITAPLEFVLIDYDGKEVKNRNITSDVTEVETTLPVVKTKELPLTVQYIEGGGATEEHVVATIEPSSILISGDAATLDGISRIRLGPVDLSTIAKSETFNLPIIIPDDTKNISGVENATVTVELRGLSTTALNITDFELINVHEDYNATVITPSLDVSIRAPSDIISKIKSNNVRIVADLSEVNQSRGLHSIQTEVYIDGFSEAGVFLDNGDGYTIVVRITENPEQEEPGT